jgi:hypothetical protein
MNQHHVYAGIVTVGLVAAAILFSVSAAAATSTDTTAVFRLTLAGAVPKDAAFNLYLQTDPPTVGETSTNFCALSDHTRPCLSGETYVSGIGGFEVGTVLVFRFERWNGERNQPIYVGRVTLTKANADVAFHVTYDYDLRLPNTAQAPPPSATRGGIWLASIGLLITVVSVVTLRRQRRVRESWPTPTPRVPHWA